MTHQNIVDKIVDAIKAKSLTGEHPSIVAIDGRSGTGKSTLAKQVGDRLSALVITCDDFYAGGTEVEWGKMTPKQKVDFCIDWKRLLVEVIKPLRAGQATQWRTFNWETQEGLSAKIIKAKPTEIIILDGIYSARPELADVVDFSILIKLADDVLRRTRLNKREGEDRMQAMQAWHAIWDEAEDYYFDHMRSPESFDLIIANN